MASRRGQIYRAHGWRGANVRMSLPLPRGRNESGPIRIKLRTESRPIKFLEQDLRHTGMVLARVEPTARAHLAHQGA